MDGFNQIVARLSTVWTESSLAGRISMVMGGVMLLLSVVGVAIWSSTPDYKLLRSDISPVLSANIVSVLEANGIPHKLNYSGTGVMVPTSRWNEANVAIASISVASSESMGSGGGMSGGLMSGNDHFDDVRLKEKALKRSIESIQVIKSAEVHLAIPEPSPFRSNRKEPSASVIVQGHGPISQETASSIIQSVAKAVEGLDPKRVSLADAEGRLLGNPANDDPAKVRRRYTKDLESQLALKAEDLLAATLGRDRAVVRVTLEVDDYIEEVLTKNEIDASAKVRLEERITSSDQKGGATGPSGVAGSGANNPTNIKSGTNSGQAMSGKQETNETTYDYPRTVLKTHKIGGQILRMSISAVVDANVASEDPAAQGQTNLLLQQAEVEDIIKSATGFQLERGDQIKVTMTRFAKPPSNDAEKELAEEEKWAFVSMMAKNASLGITALAALILATTVLRKVQPITVESSNDNEQRELVEKLSRRVDSNPEAVSRILAAWIEQQPEDSDQLSKAA